MEQHGYVKRTRSTADRRQVLVSFQPRGERLLHKVAEKRLTELRTTGQELVAGISGLLFRPKPASISIRRRFVKSPNKPLEEERTREQIFRFRYFSPAPEHSKAPADAT